MEGRPALELREGIDTSFAEKNMVVSMEPMIMIPEGKSLRAGGYREHDYFNSHW